MREKPFTLMGILNVTPDSFYDGGRYAAVDAAVEHGLQLLDEGADIIDIGGMSSRPGSGDVSSDEEARRVIPVVERLYTETGCTISVDTWSSSVARQAIDSGARWINDITAGRHDKAMPALSASSGCTMVLMHSRAEPATMQQHTDYSAYGDVVEGVRIELERAIEPFLAAGVSPQKIVVDPGIGFAKTVEQNIALLADMKAFINMGYPVLLGTSRKGFIGKLTGRESGERLYGSLGSIASAFLQGVTLFRVHDVGPTRDFLSVLAAIREHSR